MTIASQADRDRHISSRPHIRTTPANLADLLIRGARPVLIALAVFPAVLLETSYLGFWIPLGDSLAVFRPHLEVCTLLAAALLIAFRMSKAGVGLAALALVSAMSASGGAQAALPHRSGEVALYQKNLLITGRTPDAIAADIVRTAPDFVALQELSPGNLSALGGLIASYPGATVCPGRKSRGVAILSRRAFVPGSVMCFPDLDLVLAEVDLGERSVWIGSLHLRWPFPHGQHAQAIEIARILGRLDGDVVIAGDFNMVRSGSAVRRIERAAGAGVAGDIGNTFPRFGPLAPLAIDHVLLPSGVTAAVETRPLLGSDHLGLLARFSL